MWKYALTFCEPFDEQLTSLAKMESSCLMQSLLLNKQIITLKEVIIIHVLLNILEQETKNIQLFAEGEVDISEYSPRQS